MDRDSIAPGVYGMADIPMRDYLADPCPKPSLSSSAAHTILRSPAHCYARHPRLGGDKGDDSAVADTGSVAHDRLFGGEGKICVIEADDWRTKAARDQRDEARANGLMPILAAKYGAVRLMNKAAMAYLERSDLRGVLSEGAPEQTLIWEEDGCWFRCRPDWLRADLLLHYKTTKASAEPGRFGRSLFPAMGYDMAMAFYARGCRALGLDVEHRMLVQEQIAPYACSIVSMSMASWGVADAKVERAVKLWRRCMETGDWPAYPTSVHEIDPTSWALAEVEAALAEEMA